MASCRDLCGTLYTNVWLAARVLIDDNTEGIPTPVNDAGLVILVWGRSNGTLWSVNLP